MGQPSAGRFAAATLGRPLGKRASAPNRSTVHRLRRRFKHRIPLNQGVIVGRRWVMRLGKIKPLLDKARRQIVNGLGRTEADLVTGSALLYLSISEDPSRKTAERAGARRKLDRPLGLEWREMLRKAQERKAARAPE